jgi:hypothetical protein
MFRLYRKHLRTLSQLLAGVWLFAIFAGVMGCCLYSAAPQDMPAYHQASTLEQHGGHDHCAADHAPTAQHDDASCQLKHDHNLAGLLKFIQSDVSQIGALALIAVLIVHLVLIAAPLPASIRLGFVLTFTGDPPPTIRFHRFNN